MNLVIQTVPNKTARNESREKFKLCAFPSPRMLERMRKAMIELVFPSALPVSSLAADVSLIALRHVCDRELCRSCSPTTVHSADCEITFQE
jgi:hypothetical protein